MAARYCAKVAAIRGGLILPAGAVPYRNTPKSTITSYVKSVAISVFLSPRGSDWCHMKELLLGTILLLFAGDALACKCAQYSLADKKRNAAVVFVGSMQASPSHLGKQGDTISFKVSRGIKGAQAGDTIAIDPSFETDCSAPFQSGVDLLVFAYKSSIGLLTTNACGVRTVQPIYIDGKISQPSPETIKFLQSERQLRSGS